VSLLKPGKEGAEALVESPSALQKVQESLQDLLGRRDEIVHETFEAQEDLKAIKAFEIPNQEQLDLAQAVTADLKAKKKQIEEQKEKVTKPLNELLRLVHAIYLPVLTSMESGEAELKKKMASALTRFQEEQTKALAAVSAAVRAGDLVTAKKHMNETTEARLPTGMSIRDIWKFRIADPAKIEDKYLMVVVNEAAVQAAIDAGAREIPGFEVYKVDSVTIRQPGKA
jgi:predicted SnoaL-like aldol condensation-catalyzing enzyme